MTSGRNNVLIYRTQFTCINLIWLIKHLSEHDLRILSETISSGRLVYLAFTNCTTSVFYYESGGRLAFFNSMHISNSMISSHVLQNAYLTPIFIPCAYRVLTFFGNAKYFRCSMSDWKGVVGGWKGISKCIHLRIPFRVPKTPFNSTLDSWSI